MTPNRIPVGGIMSFRDLCLIGVMAAPDRPGIGAAIFEALGAAHLNAQFIVQSADLNNESHVLFCVAEEDAERALEYLSPVAEQLAARDVRVQDHVSLVSVFGPDFRERPGIAGAAFGALARAGINILAISTSISTVSCVIGADDFEAATQALYEVFRLP